MSVPIHAASPVQRRRAGLGMVVVGALAAWAMRVHPAGLRVPAWVGYSAAASFVLAGAAVWADASDARRTYRWCVVGLLSLMTVVPAWIAFGPGARECRAAPVALGAVGCRVAFGAGTVLLLAAWVAAVASARARPSHEGTRARTAS